MTDGIADDAQPPEGQDAPAGGQGSPYQEYLDRLPEEVRGQVEPVFRDWDASTTKRFQEAAEYRRQWEPYEQAGLNQIPAQDAPFLAEFYTAMQQNPQAISQWYQQYAEQNGLTPQQAAELEQQAYVDPDMQALLEQQFQQRLGPISQQLEQLSQWQQQQDAAAREAEAMRSIEGQLSELASKHGDGFSREGVEKFVAQYIETDPSHAVERAFADYQSLVAAIEKGYVSKKLAQPAAPESGGQAATGAEPLKGTSKDILQQAAARAREQLTQRP